MAYTIWDFHKICTLPNLMQKRDSIKDLIESQQLSGFFGHTQPPEPTGIALNYDVEEVKRTINEAAGEHYQPEPTIRK